jgi:small subunit ribosomal protein S7e
MVIATAAPKCVKPEGRKVDELEKQVSQAMTDLESSSEIKQQLRELYFVKAKEVDAAGKKALLIYVPMPQLKAYHKIHPRLVRELEKKFSGKHVLVVGWRRVIQKPKRGAAHKPLKQKRPRNRTLTSVHNEILSDLVYPAEIVGKRIRVKLDGKRVTKVHLDKNQETTVGHKTNTFGAVYKSLTGKEVTFEFPDPIF